MPADRPKGEPQMKNAHSTPATPGLLRRRLTLALLAFSVFVGTFAATAPPAHAASSMAACFYTPNKTRLTGLPVQLEYWNGYKWVFTGLTFPVQQDNCLTLNLTGAWQAHYLRFNVSFIEGVVVCYLNPGMPIPHASPGKLHYPLGYLSVICSGSITRCGVDY